MEQVQSIPDNEGTVFIFDTSPARPRVSSEQFLASDLNAYELRTAQRNPMSARTAKVEAQNKLLVLLATKKSVAKRKLVCDEGEGELMKLRRTGFDPNKENVGALQLQQVQGRSTEKHCVMELTKFPLKMPPLVDDDELAVDASHAQKASSPPKMFPLVPSPPKMPPLAEAGGDEVSHKSEAFQMMKSLAQKASQGETLDNSELTKAFVMLYQRLEVLENANPDLYAPHNLTRPLAVINLLRLLVDFLNGNLSKIVAKTESDWVAKEGKVFTNKNAVSYTTAFWFQFKHLEHASNKPLIELHESLTSYWTKKNILTVEGAKQLNNIPYEMTTWDKQDKRDGETFLHAINVVVPGMQKSERAVIKFVGSKAGITPILLRDVVGFYSGFMVKHRNVEVHVFQILFGLGKGCSRPSFELPEQFTIDDKVDLYQLECARDMIEDILGHLNHLPKEWPAQVSMVLEWFGTKILNIVKSRIRKLTTA